MTFTYSEREPVVRDCSLDIAARETIAITGENGAGKTTLISMLMRFFEPQNVRILIDGIDIAVAGLTRLREQIAVVLRNVFLFNGTVGDNIGYGRSDIGEADVVQAAQLAQAHPFIATLPSGYDTIIGGHGVRLSGGPSGSGSLWHERYSTIR